MRKLTSILLIFLTFPILQFGQQEEEKRTPKIGLLTFSVNAFDEESQKINTSLRGLKDIIRNELKGKENDRIFKIEEESTDVITYSDIELPEVTIDPVVEPETNKKLEQLCKQDWDGLVFGHFHQEDKLIVVSRIYLSKKKYTNLKKDERIISSPEIEIPTTNLDQRSLESHTTQSLQELIKAIKTKRPEVFESVRKEVKKEPSQKIMEPPKQEPKPKPQDTKPAQVKEQTTIEEDYGVVPLTARNVYNMVIEKGFYCEIVKGSGFHGEGLDETRVPKDGIFREKRIVIGVEDSGLIRTENQAVENVNDKILLWWSLGKINKCSYKSAGNDIEKLNNEYKGKDKNKRWRIPTLMEVFSIVKEKTNNHFPNIFKFPAKTDLIFWTSTPVKKEGTVLDYEKQNKAYFVVESKYNGKTGNYSLSFSFKNMEANDAYLLPVYSNKVYTYTPIPGFDTDSNNAAPIAGGKDNIPGFDDDPGNNTRKNPVLTPSNKTQKEVVSKKSQDNPQKSGDSEKIPGFDDMPVSHKNSSQKAHSPITVKKYQPKKIKISLIPYFDKAIYGSTKEQELNDINYDIEQLVLNELKEKVRAELYRDLEIDNKRTDGQVNASLLEEFYQIISTTPGKPKEVKVGRIISDIMGPNNIDILVSVSHGVGWPGERLEYLGIFIISLVDNTQSNDKFPNTKNGHDRLKEYVRKEIEKVLYKKIF
jgi:hypothetical protein